MKTFLLTPACMDHAESLADLSHLDPTKVHHGYLGKEQVSNRSALVQDVADDRPLASSKSERTVVLYVRATCASVDSAQEQAETLVTWAKARGIEADERWTEYTCGDLASEALSHVLRRARSGERILLAMASANRISVDEHEWRSFLSIARMSDLEVMIVDASNSVDGQTSERRCCRY
ncbi:hypothetical protein EON82_22700 [bacterium]|nr:MAG: hypothetical protein EON82_22700 [bacterium]